MNVNNLIYRSWTIADTPYYYPDSATVVFPGGPQQSAHESSIYPIVIGQSPYPPFVQYPGYPDVVYPIYPTGGSVHPQQKVTSTTQSSLGHDERVVCQEHVKRIKVRW